MHEPAIEPRDGLIARLTSPSGTLLVFGVLVVARLLAGGFGYFYEGDEISIAAGVAALMAGDVGPLYRYGPQLGYYRLIEVLARWAGGPHRIHTVMVITSAMAGALIPACALRAFRHSLAPRTRLLAAAILFASPALWVASQYGNAATVSTAFVVLSVTLLSNRPKGLRLAVALACYAAGVLARADAVLVAPMVAVLVFQGARTGRGGVLALGTAALAGAGLYGVLFVVDPALKGMLSQVASHFTEDNETLFFEHLVWAFSPFVLAFSVLGLREAMARHGRVAAALLAGVLPLCLFYFPTTTTTRYFLQASFAFAIFAALGMESAAALVAPRRRAAAWTLIASLAFVHLFMGLGRFQARPFLARFQAPSYGTHDSAMYTGALLYQGYLDGGVFGRSLRGPRFGTRNELALSMDGALERLAAGEGPPHAVLFFHDWNGHAAVYHLLVAGARRQGENIPSTIADPSVYRLGRSDVHVLWFGPATRQLPSRLPVDAADEIWLLGPQPGFPQEDVLGALAPGLELVPKNGAASYLQVFGLNQEVQ